MLTLFTKWDRVDVDVWRVPLVFLSGRTLILVALWVPRRAGFSNCGGTTGIKEAV